MKRITDCPRSSVRKKGQWHASVVDEGTGMVLDVLSDVPCVAHALDGTQWGSGGRRPDGVVVFEHEPHGGVVFVELKGKVDPDEPDRPFDQILAGVQHFSNSENHGGAHHEQWAGGQDLPLAAAGRRPAPVSLGPEHVTFGVIVVSRGGTRVRPRVFECNGRRCMIVVVQRHGVRGRTSIELVELLVQAGV